MRGMLQEADSIADVHLDKKTQLLQEVQATVKQWRGENYHKGMMGPCKETKHLEDEFRKVHYQDHVLVSLTALCYLNVWSHQCN